MRQTATSLESKELQQQTEKISRFLERSKRWMRALLVLTILTPIVSYWVYYDVASSRLRQEFFNYVESIALMAASQVDPVAHARMISATGANGDERAQIRDRLVRMHERMQQVHYLTTLVVRDNEGYIAIDTTADARTARNGKPVQPSAYLEQYPAQPEDYENYGAITRGESYIFTEPYTDVFGTFIGACAPVEAVEGAWPTMACVDVDAADYAQHLQTFRTRFLYTSLIGAGLCLLILFSLYQHQNHMKWSIALIAHQRDVYLKSANSDPLTGALNRRSFALAFESAEAQFQRRRQRFAVISLDIDHFKEINDRHGHDCGDKVLTELVHTLNNSLRSGDVVARLGGEEFTVLCYPTKVQDALIVAEKLRTKVQKMLVHAPDASPMHITISAGVYFVEEGDSMDFALKAADTALYHAKRRNRNCVVEYSEGVAAHDNDKAAKAGNARTHAAEMVI
jgi:diguanylate cyclase (GGDEF)-like protein